MNTVYTRHVMDTSLVAAEAAKQPTVAVRPALRFVAIPLAFVSALLIMAGQVRLGHQQTTLALCHNGVIDNCSLRAPSDWT
jgi:hypothetical protein